MNDEVIAFSREYINHRSARTAERKRKIREALKSLTGETINTGCAACYIEAIFKIIKLTKMANYELKRGVLLQEFGYPDKACTSLTITDELAKWHLNRHPEKAVYFSKIPSDFVPKVNVYVPPPPPPRMNFQRGDRRIITPDKIVLPEDKKEPESLVEKLIKEAPVIKDVKKEPVETPKIEVKSKTIVKKKSKK